MRLWSTCFQSVSKVSTQLEAGRSVEVGPSNVHGVLQVTIAANAGNWVMILIVTEVLMWCWVLVLYQSSTYE